MKQFFLITSLISVLTGCSNKQSEPKDTEGKLPNKNEDIEANVTQDENMDACINKIKQINYAIRIYMVENNGRNPWQVSPSNEIDGKGDDLNPLQYYKMMQEIFTNPVVLFCPSNMDQSTRLVLESSEPETWDLLSPEDPFYKLRTGSHVHMDNPLEVAVWCPVHNVVGLANGASIPTTQAEVESRTAESWTIE